MARRLIETFHGRPLLDIASYARGGPQCRDRLSPEKIALISRTVSRTPEVAVKVLTRGGQNMKAVRAHLAYLNRGGELEIETDDGERLAGDEVERQLLKDWDLDIEAERERTELTGRRRPSPPKLVHKILFSMPPGTSPQSVLKAVREFGREEFSLRHRYAMVLHTDEPHPHVHMMVKAVSEQGTRLNIRKETLRRWRAEFASHLRRLGVAANATERAVRGENRPPLRDSIYRAGRRGESRVLNRRLVAGLQDARAIVNSQRLHATRELVQRGWREVAALLESERADLAAKIDAYVLRMLVPRVESRLSIHQLVQPRPPERERQSPTR
jgi:hypothetical protein